MTVFSPTSTQACRPAGLPVIVQHFHSFRQLTRRENNYLAASYPKGTRGLFPGVKRPGLKLTTHLHLVPKSRMRRAIPPLPQYAFMAWCPVEAQGQLYLYIISFNINFSSMNGSPGYPTKILHAILIPPHSVVISQIYSFFLRKESRLKFVRKHWFR
jgi:hypothetical protein